MNKTFKIVKAYSGNKHIEAYENEKKRSLILFSMTMMLMEHVGFLRLLAIE